MNARQELIEHIGDREVKYVHITSGPPSVHRKRTSASSTQSGVADSLGGADMKKQRAEAHKPNPAGLVIAHENTNED